MTKPALAIGANGNKYRFAFTTDDGKAVVEVSVRLDGRPDTRSAVEKKELALKKLKRIAKALSEAIREEST